MDILGFFIFLGVALFFAALLVAIAERAFGIVMGIPGLGMGIMRRKDGRDE